MKKIFIIFLLSILIIGIVYFFLPVCAPGSQDICIYIPRWKYILIKNKEVILYQLNNKTYKLYTARNPQKWEKGLMYYRKLDDADGMVFFFPDKKIRNFWNKNTFMDLDLYWLNDMAVIGKSYLPSIEKSKDIVIVTSPDKANTVIELQAGK